MPLKRCTIGGKSGWRWGDKGRCYTGPQGRSRALRQARAIKLSQANNKLVFNANPKRVDPTQTTMIQREFVKEVNRRLNAFWKLLVKLLVEEDAFGLRPDRQFKPTKLKELREAFSAGTLNNDNNQSLSFSQDNQNVVSNTRYKHLDMDEKLERFQEWLAETTGLTIIPEEDRFWETFVQRGYEKGAGKAFDRVNKPVLSEDLGARGVFQGSKDMHIRAMLSAPESVAKVKLLSARVLSEYQNLSEKLRTSIAGKLAEGLVQGDNPNTIARRMVNDLNIQKRSAIRISRTEIIRAHAEGALDSMEKLGVEEVSVAVEWSTAGDTRVCPLCAPLEGMVIPIKKAHGMFPRHASCRCSPIPANVGEPTTGQKRTKAAVQKAIDRSVSAEIPKREDRSLKRQKSLSPWIGAKRKAVKAPKSLIGEIE